MNITQRIQHVRSLIHETAVQCKRDPQTIRLVGVTKGQPVEAIMEAHAAGLTEFAESYWQEAQPKLLQLAHLPITWHFIGPLQSNKTAVIAEHFDWFHSLSQEKIAQRLARQRPEDKPPLQVLLQINLDQEPTKSGILPEAANALATQIQQLPRLHLTGLMAIPKLCPQEIEQYTSFLRLTALRDELNRKLPQKICDLSMGMSEDFIAAIRAGSTIVRIGQTIFGPRKT